MRNRKATVDKVTQMRLDQLLPRIMREAGFDMWIMISNEDNYDPVFLTMVPYDAWCPITQILVFSDPGEGKAIERLNISRTNMEGLHQKSWTPPHTRMHGEEGQWKCLARIVKEKNPKKIGINESDVIWAADGLTASLKRKLVETIGPEYAKDWSRQRRCPHFGWRRCLMKNLIFIIVQWPFPTHLLQRHSPIKLSLLE